jgi:two-component system sensor histidine kinase CreC
VALTLRGEYGARATREPCRPMTAAVMVRGRTGDRRPAAARPIGVLAVAKPLATVQPFIDRAERKIFVAGLAAGLSLAIGVAVTLWTVHSVRRCAAMRSRHVIRRRAAPGAARWPANWANWRGNGHMRDRLEGRAQVEHACAR